MQTLLESSLVRVRLFTMAVIAMFTSGCLVVGREAPPPTYVGTQHVASAQVEVAEPVAATEEVVVEDPDLDPAAVSEFRGELEPYGTWVEEPRTERSGCLTLRSLVPTLRPM
jgi:hypothetical protein